MSYKFLGDSIEGEKIVLEAGFIKITRGVVRSQGHHGDRATGMIRSVAYISKAYTK